MSELQNICTECEQNDDIGGQWVQCDECDRWAHFRCAEVGPEIENLDWSCGLCRSKAFICIGETLYFFTCTSNTIEKLLFYVTRFKDNEK